MSGSAWAASFSCARTGETDKCVAASAPAVTAAMARRARIPLPSPPPRAGGAAVLWQNVSAVIRKIGLARFSLIKLRDLPKLETRSRVVNTRDAERWQYQSGKCGGAGQPPRPGGSRRSAGDVLSSARHTARLAAPKV